MIYRGKRIKNGEMVEGDLWQPVRQNLKLAFILRQDNKYEVHPESLAMETTVCDKNSKMIFGSIPINGKMSEGGDNTNNGIVKWSETEFAWQCGDSLLYEVASDIEIIDPDNPPAEGKGQKK